MHSRKMETEIVSMTASMLNGRSETVGFLTSGGTESNLMAVKTFRDRARKLHPHITKPNIVNMLSHFLLSTSRKLAYNALSYDGRRCYSVDNVIS